MHFLLRDLKPTATSTGYSNLSKSPLQANILPSLIRCPNFIVQTHKEVLQVDNGKTKNGVEGFQSADMVCITTYQMNRVRMILRSKISESYNPQTGSSTVRRNYSFHTCAIVIGFFHGKRMNRFIVGTGNLGFTTNDFPMQYMDTLLLCTKR